MAHRARDASVLCEHKTGKVAFGERRYFRSACNLGQGRAMSTGATQSSCTGRAEKTNTSAACGPPSDSIFNNAK
eukprot:15472709-Alexandrium_andersonii.AAC.1